LSRRSDVKASTIWHYDDDAFADFDEDSDTDWDAAWNDIWLQKWKAFHINQKRMQSEAMQEGKPFVGLTDVAHGQYMDMDALIMDAEQRATYARLYNDMNRRSMTHLQFAFASLCAVSAAAWMIGERGACRHVARVVSVLCSAFSAMSYVDTQPCTRRAYAREMLHGFGRFSLRPFKAFLNVMGSYATWVRASQRPCEVPAGDNPNDQRHGCLVFDGTMV
jgi:hypothetical protein